MSKSNQSLRVSHWTKQIERLKNNRRYAWAKEFLEDIGETINDTQTVTDKQVRAIKNIQNGRNSIYQ